jgi:Mrp family chromosome partitioning ATPase
MSDAGGATAFVGATGGAGTTRTVVEVAALYAADGHDVAVLDAAFATQGLASYLAGSLSPDLTALVTDEPERPLPAGLVDLEAPTPGRVACCPAHAAFERVARAKAPAAAERFDARVAEAVERFDAVLVDVPPVAANQAVAAVTACDRVVLLAPASTRGADALGRVDARLADLGVPVDAAVSTFGALPDADAVVPESAVRDVADAPTAVAGEDGFAPAVAAATEVALDCTLSTEYDEGGVLEDVRRYVGGRE